MAKKKTSKKTAKKTAKKVAKKTAKKAAKKVAKKVDKKAAAKKKKVTKKVTKEKSNTPVETKAEEEEVVVPIKLEGENLKKEIKELENADSGKKTLPPPAAKKPGRGGTRRVKPKHVVTARKAGPGLKFAPGVMLSGAKKKEEAPKKAEEPQEFRRLTKDELVKTRIKLIDLRESILENMRKELADYRQRASSSSADPVDQAADAYDDDVTFEIAANNDQELEQIDSALEKIEKGTYGLCEMCSVTISPSRLKILPFATRCVECRQTYEKTKVKKDNTNSWAFIEGEGTETDS